MRPPPQPGCCRTLLMPREPRARPPFSAQGPSALAWSIARVTGTWSIARDQGPSAMDQASALARVTVSLDFPSGKLDTFTVPSLWRDIKVYQNHAFIGAEASGHGMQVIDLTTLREFYGKDARGKNIRHLTVAEHYPEFGEARLRVFGGKGGSSLWRVWSIFSTCVRRQLAQSGDQRGLRLSLRDRLRHLLRWPAHRRHPGPEQPGIHRMRCRGRLHA